MGFRFNQSKNSLRYTKKKGAVVLTVILVFTVGLLLLLWKVESTKAGAAYPLQLCQIMGPEERLDSLLGDSKFLWNKKQIRVCFLDDDGNVRQRVMQILKDWEICSGRQFVYASSNTTSDIRVSFRSKGWWSYIGNYALQIRKDAPTLSLSQLYAYSATKFKSVVLHEFGHALGLTHEHQHPGLTIKWLKDTLYRYYKREYDVDPGWVDSNVIEKYNSATAIYCEPDPHSIMIYEIPPGVTQDNFSIPWPKGLSPLDKKYIKAMYQNKTCDDIPHS